jgi:hypothetical protein
MLGRMSVSEQQPEQQAARHAPIALWRAAGAFIATLFHLFGGPEQIAEGEVLTDKARALLLSWLRAGEAFVRRLLLVEAAAYASDLPPVRRPRVRKRRARRVMCFSADKPGEWRVSFRMVEARVSARRATRKASAAPRRERRFHSAWPIAERYEALLRAYNDPAPYARRLARRLRQRPSLANAIFAAPDNAPRLVGEDFWHADTLALRAERAFNSS